MPAIPYLAFIECMRVIKSQVQCKFSVLTIFKMVNNRLRELVGRGNRRAAYLKHHFPERLTVQVLKEKDNV